MKLTSIISEKFTKVISAIKICKSLKDGLLMEKFERLFNLKDLKIFTPISNQQAFEFDALLRNLTKKF